MLGAMNPCWEVRLLLGGEGGLGWGGRWWLGVSCVPVLFRVPGAPGIAAAAPCPSGALLAGIKGGLISLLQV
jgi:hypothetical protein